MESLSRRLVYYLRHDPAAPRDSAGYVTLQHLSEYFHLTRPTLNSIVDLPADKKRLFLSPCGEKMRAGAGHSVTDVNIDHLAELVTDAATVTYCRHATTIESWNRIREKGLRPMSRRYVHFAHQPSSLRQHREVVLSLKVRDYLASVQKLYQLPNGCYAAMGNRHGTIRPCYLTARKLPRFNSIAPPEPEVLQEPRRVAGLPA
ncbi:probable RNA 2'-phosphotransferase [Ylistrum balloti]|uniref:probable RNA 2'-phosphotransferase n=1 Tax=Ylistrum balloti TaxID=509963 RepID=UPI002905B580|nr:probable RNA 2'-phosphotransferase [Ylistrum balloti]